MKPSICPKDRGPGGSASSTYQARSVAVRRYNPGWAKEPLLVEARAPKGSASASLLGKSRKGEAGNGQSNHRAAPGRPRPRTGGQRTERVPRASLSPGRG